jgi:Fe-S-cluster containining protein
LSGEAEYIAAKTGLSLEEFRGKYLDGLLAGKEVVDLIKCTVRCPLLDPKAFSCQFSGFKPVMCLVYPLLFEPRDGAWRYFIDDRCPISRIEPLSSYLLGEGLELARQFLTDDRWLSCTYILDQYSFDYAKMEAIRSCPVDQYRVFTLDEILSCRS